LSVDNAVNTLTDSNLGLNRGARLRAADVLLVRSDVRAGRAFAFRIRSDRSNSAVSERAKLYFRPVQVKFCDGADFRSAFFGLIV
jgi:hypothetical protein